MPDFPIQGLRPYYTALRDWLYAGHNADGSHDPDDVLPDQAGRSGQVLTSDGNTADWGNVPSHIHETGDIDATGTPDSSTFLRGDGTWAEPESDGGLTEEAADALYAPVSVVADIATNAADIADLETGVDEARGRSRTLLYDDFSTYPNGSPSGETTAVGGITWVTSGAEPPTVTSGALNSTGSGYLVADLGSDVPVKIDGDFAFSSDSGSATLSIYRSDVGSFGSMVHFEFDTEGGLVTVRANGGSFDPIMTPAWSPFPVDGTRRRVSLTVEGSMVTVVGPYGQVFAAYDPRIGETLGSATDAVYWQASDDCTLHSVGVYGTASSGVTAPTDRPAEGTRITPTRFHVAAAPFEPWQVKIGPDNDGNPAIQFGAVDGARTVLLAGISIGASSFQVPVPLYNYSSAVIGYGTNAETVTISSISGSTNPFTVNLSGTTTKAHSRGAAVLASPPGWGTKSIKVSLGDGGLYLPGGTFVTGLLELGTDRDAGVQRSAAGTVQAMGAGGTAAVFRTRNGSTGDRPSASTVGAGAIYFDSTLNKLITSNGTDWRDGSGTAV